jgi:hypothetical protein
MCDCGLSQHAKRMRHHHLCPIWLYHIFPYDLINGTIFGNVMEHVLPADFYIFLILKRIKRDITNVHSSSCELPVILVGLIKLVFSRQIFQNYSNCQIPRKSVQWEPRCFTRTDRRHDASKSLFATLRTRLKMVRKYTPTPGSYETRSNEQTPDALR